MSLDQPPQGSDAHPKLLPPKTQEIIESLAEAIESSSKEAEEQLKQVRADIAIANSKLEVKKEQLDKYDDLLKARTGSIVELDLKWNKIEQSHNDLIESYDREHQRKEDSLKELGARPAKIKKELHAVELELKERHQYLVSQELTIANAVDQGNDEIREVSSKLNGLHAENDSILRNIIKLKQEVKDREDMIEDLDAKIDSLDERYDEMAAEYRKSLDELKEQISIAGEDNKRIRVDTEQQLKKIEIAQKELTVAREVLAKERKDFDFAKRRFESNKAIYGG